MKRHRRTTHNMAKAKAGWWLMRFGKGPEPPDDWTDLERRYWAQVARPQPDEIHLDHLKRKRSEPIRCRICGGKIKAKSRLDVCSRHEVAERRIPPAGAAF